MTLTRTEELTCEMDILLTTAEYIPNCKVQYLMGIVSGNNVLDLRDAKRNIMNKGVFPKEICPTILENARDVAIKKMAENAISIGSDAVINIKIETNVIGKIIEFYVYGTAVRLLPLDDEEFMDDEDECMYDEDECMYDEDECMYDEDECICTESDE